MTKERIDNSFDWKNLGSNNGHEKATSLSVPAADFTTGDSYRFVATITAKTGMSTSVESNDFIIL